MSKANIFWDKLTLGSVIFALFMTMNCTENQPLTVTEKKQGAIVGIIKPLGVVAQVKVKQGFVIDSTYSDTTNGFFKIDSLQVGFYTLDVEAVGYGKYVENKIQVVSNGITSVGEIQLKPIPEQILSIFPPNGSVNYKLTDSCGFKFTTLMDHNSVENNFTITPEIEGYFHWIENEDNSTVYFNPNTQYMPYTTYIFSLNTKAKTIYGDTLSFGISSSFITEPVKVEFYTPDDGATFVIPSVSIYIRFNTAMNRASVESSFDISPSVIGNFFWHNNESFNFIPNVLLATNTQFITTISTNARDINGTGIGEPFSLSFTTEPLKITYTNPSNGATFINTNTTIGLNFNTNMDQTATENAFSIEPSVNGNFVWIDLTKFTYYPEINLTPDIWYTVMIDTSCKDSYGKKLPANYSFSFKTRSE